ncbi:MAG: SRPBCC family protein [Bacteroidia bacterium]|nr:SRPBCC family protein [Bacteroidia bacterium]
MKANIEKTFEIDQPVEKVWAFLSDIEKVVTCVPGAQLTEKVDDSNYKGKVSLKFGPVAAAYDGAITIDTMDANSHNMVLSGTGMDSKGKGSAGMTLNSSLTSKDPKLTEVGYNMDVTVTGKLAQFGSRLIVDVSDQLADQFIAKFKAALAEEAAQEAAHENVAAEAGGGSATATATTAPPKPKAAAEENSLSVFAILGGLIKRFFARLFGRS